MAKEKTAETIILRVGHGIVAIPRPNQAIGLLNDPLPLADHGSALPAGEESVAPDEERPPSQW